MTSILLFVSFFACTPTPVPEGSAVLPAVSTPAVPPVGPAQVAYVLRIPRPEHHRVLVEATHVGAGPTVWMMPTWTPGSYLVREYARHVEEVSAADAAGAPLAVKKVAKNRWAVDAVGPYTLRWTLHAREASVRSNVVDADVGVLNGASTFLVPLDGAEQPVTGLELTVELPSAWSGIETSLPLHPDGRPAHYLAPDFDTLVDSPIVMGDLVVRDVVAADVPHRLVLLGDVHRLDADRAAEDLARLAEAQIGFWGGAPYTSYRFLHLVGYGRGGLEHRNDTLVMSTDVDPEDDKAWTSLLGLYSHEQFHAWNVKRLRPAGLGPFDYEHEALTPNLWVAEGLTAYYDDLLLVRAGLLESPLHVERLGEQVRDAVDRPGARVQSVADAGRDAWIKFYRGDDHSPNHTVSYYTKGATVGWLLDVEIRRRTEDRRSLDDVLRLLWTRFADGPGYTDADVRAAASEVAGADLAPFFDAYVDGTAELDLAPALAWLGLRWKPATPPEDGPDGWAGLRHDDRLVITEIRRDTPAWEAGLQVGDELLAVDGVRLSAANVGAEIARLEPGAAPVFTLSRRGRLRTLPLTVAAAPTETWVLEADPAATTAALAHRRRWQGE